MLKQRNLIVRPENADVAEREMQKLEHFGWTRVHDTPCPDGSVLISYVRDDEEKRALADDEFNYRSAKLAAEFATEAKVRLGMLDGAKQVKKKSKAPIVIFAILTVLFLALTIVFAVWDGIYDYVLFENLIFGGDWKFLNNPSLSTTTAATPYFFIMVSGTLTLLFLSLMMSSIRAVKEYSLDSGDYVIFAFDEDMYFDEVKTEAAAEAARLYPEA